MSIYCVEICLKHVHTVYVQVCTCLTRCSVQANSKDSTGCVRLDINLLKPSRIEFAQDQSASLLLSAGHLATPLWLEYVYRTVHPVLRWLPTKLAEWIGDNVQDVYYIIFWKLSTCMYQVYTRLYVICTCRYNVFTIMCFMISLFLYRIPSWLSLLTLTALKRIPLMSPRRTVGMLAHSSSLLATFIQKMEELPRIHITQTLP